MIVYLICVKISGMEGLSHFVNVAGMRVCLICVGLRNEGLSYLCRSR